MKANPTRRDARQPGRIAAGRTAGVATLLAGLPLWATAHVGGDHAHDGLFAGLMHPFTGTDHLVAMLAVGCWSALVARRARPDLWLVPLGFVVVLVLGALLGAGGVPLPAVEPLIAASLVALGLLVAVQARLPLAAAVALVGAFGLFHGHAHGAELGAGTALVGMALGSALLHALGMAAGLLVRERSRWWPRLAGAATLAFGAALLVGG
ncbi:HupE/UreJ family protein [Azohydromonas sediminis]|uniref:HupE/UreJ family protein n=1 Tax=Azohydromonas sediminis TaxID=2259674 RepID=UPI000E65B7C3|nr:HupE/UreJ family protein [Azohydromonas sediminis]